MEERREGGRERGRIVGILFLLYMDTIPAVRGLQGKEGRREGARQGWREAGKAYERYVVDG